jgi:hypothetical protein
VPIADAVLERDLVDARLAIVDNKPTSKARKGLRPRRKRPAPNWSSSRPASR